MGPMKAPKYLACNFNLRICKHRCKSCNGSPVISNGLALVEWNDDTLLHVYVQRSGSPDQDKDVQEGREITLHVFEHGRDVVGIRAESGDSGRQLVNHKSQHRVNCKSKDCA